MSQKLRHEVISAAKTVVVKVGTSVLSNDDDTLDVGRIASLVEQIWGIRQSGRKVVIVTSGAVGAGIGLLGLSGRPRDLPHLQAAAATGQAHLMRVYNDCLEKHGYKAAQLLLTANDFRTRERYLNLRNTLSTLFEYPVVPIINENDTVSIDEIKFGDNDQLASMVNNLMDDSLLIILSVIDGLFAGDPRLPDSKLLRLVDHWDDSLLGLATDSKSKRGTGGMHSKLQSVRRATEVGDSVIIANGKTDDVLTRLMAGEELGTLFLSQGEPLPAWKRWIGYTVAPAGKLHVDQGATEALVKKGRSLLAIGITRIEGEFETGDVVSICSPDGIEIGRGLTNYTHREAQLIRGRRTEDIAAILGDTPYDEVIHRDNLAVIVG